MYQVLSLYLQPLYCAISIQCVWTDKQHMHTVQTN